MRALFITLVVFFSTNVVKSQVFESILIASDDASLLMENYTNPVIRGLMSDMNNGWYTTAKTHKKLGFDVTITANVALVPKSDEMFAFIPTDYSYLSLPNGENELPTLMSSSNTDTRVNVQIDNGNGTFNVASFDMPGGIKDDLPINAVPTPMVQFGLGLPFKTDIKLRVVPKISFDDNLETNLFGLGLQHDLMQYLGPLENLPLNVSLLAAFTNMKVTYTIGDDDLSDDIISSNALAEFKMKTWTLQALASLDFKILTVYGGVGYNNGTATTKIKGDYTINYDVEDGSGNFITTVSEIISNPINLDFSANNIKATLGARINIGFFKIFTDYSFQKYNTVTAGIAFSFR